MVSSSRAYPPELSLDDSTKIKLMNHIRQFIINDFRDINLATLLPQLLFVGCVGMLFGLGALR